MARLPHRRDGRLAVSSALVLLAAALFATDVQVAVIFSPLVVLAIANLVPRFHAALVELVERIARRVPPWTRDIASIGGARSEFALRSLLIRLHGSRAPPSGAVVT